MTEQSTLPSNIVANILAKAVSVSPQRQLSAGECRTPSGTICTLCSAHRIEYAQEKKAKNEALQQFWELHCGAQPFSELVPSPLGRNYRVVTKRKVFISAGKIQLGLIGVDEGGAGLSPIQVGHCAIEPEPHARIYRLVQDFFQRREMRNLGETMNYVIIKGNYEQFTVIFNLALFSPEIRQIINRLSKHITEAVPGVSGVFIVVDEKRSQYYMPQRNERQKQQFQKIFGKSAVFQKVSGRKFFFSPLSFSQTNLSIMEVFISTMKELLALGPGDHLLDLYSGYGVFSLSLAGHVRKVTGVEISNDAISDAIENARRQNAANCRFLHGDIDGESLERIFSSQRTITKVILDPPRNGTKPDVIEIIAAKNIHRALHIFCNIDLLPSELKRWKQCGYEVASAIPFDMFPGTNEAEIMVLLKRS